MQDPQHGPHPKHQTGDAAKRRQMPWLRPERPLQRFWRPFFQSSSEAQWDKMGRFRAPVHHRDLTKMMWFNHVNQQQNLVGGSLTQKKTGCESLGAQYCWIQAAVSWQNVEQ